MSLQIRNQLRAMQASRLRVAQRIDLKLETFQSQSPAKVRTHGDVLCVDVWSGESKRLHPHLMKLTITAFLRTLVAEHRPHVKQPLSAVIEQVVFDHRAYARSGALWTQRQALPIELIDKGVHFFLNDVGHFADRTYEQFGSFEDRHGNIAVDIMRQPCAHRISE